MKIFIVGKSNAEGCSIESVHRTYGGALVAWNAVRLSILSTFESINDDHMWDENIKALQCKDPKKIDNYPHETPQIWKYDLEE